MIQGVLEQVLQRIAICFLLASAVVLYLPGNRPARLQVLASFQQSPAQAPPTCPHCHAP